MIWNGTVNTAWYNETAIEFTINTAEDLAGFAKLATSGNDFAGKSVKLGTHIVLNSVTDFKNWETSPPVNVWTPVGKPGKFSGGFMGAFDGGGYIISGIYINSTEDNRSLFEYIGNDGIIKNLGVTASYVKGGNVVGGLIGYNDGGTIINSYFSGTVAGGELVGGFVGANGGKISDCYFSGTTKGTKRNVGGFAGNNYGTISKSYSTGTVAGADYAGGLVGEDTKGNIDNCYSACKVAGTDNIGGLVGLDFKGSINNSYSTGTVTGTGKNVGGLVGCNDNTTINSSYSASKVVGTDYVGGLVGGNLKGTVNNSYSTGVVDGKSYVGGLIGDNIGNLTTQTSANPVANLKGTVSNSYSIGLVKGEKNVGGLIGSNGHHTVTFGDKVTSIAPVGKIINSYYDKDTSGQNETDRGMPKYTAQMKRVATYTDWDFTQIWGLSDTINNGYPHLRPTCP
ncbi:MAG: hypothetical protein LBH25_01910 [Fibromonadaceae bacterium]|jgi:hypothetical protein|nr:hypothetical protein [Fibromonadaceae bacterium]